LIIHSKGFLPVTHALTELVKEVPGAERLDLPGVEELRWLQEHYLQSRCQNARMSEYTREEASRALQTARRVVDVVKRRVEG